MYLDPGAGSVILQVIIAAVLGAGVFFKLFWKKIRAAFGKQDVRESQPDKE